VLLLILAACSYLPHVPGCNDPKPTGPVSITPPKPKIEIGGPGSTTPAQPLDPTAPVVAMEKDNCADLQDGGPVQGPDCVTQVVKCNTVVYGHTFGGTDRFDSRFYEAHMCTPRTTNHDSGDERVYLLEMPAGDHRVKAWLDTPCADLDLTIMTVPDATTCPTTKDGLLKICDMWPMPGTQREHVEIATQGKTNLMFVVEGKNKDEGAFALTVQCSEGLY
jgi:hypothetical protein